MSIRENGRLLSWYGDDFTGSAAVLEVLAFAGVEAVLFLDVPTQAQLAAFPNAQAIGLAGVARSFSPKWMDENLPPIFEALARLGAPLVHYKICSTLDSSPEIGSIGRAAEIGQRHLDSAWSPVLVAAPPIGRYQAFGHLFASSSQGTVRLDRHPVMSRHPVTPMGESDVALHLSKQTSEKAGCIDLLGLRGPDKGLGALKALRNEGARLITCDTIDQSDLVAAGELIWNHRAEAPLVIGSQGIEYALIAYWNAISALPVRAAPQSVGDVSQIAAVSGSVSATTAEQIAWAGNNGFGLIAFDAAAVADPAGRARAVNDAVEDSKAVLSSGKSVLVHSARGPDDPAVETFRKAVSASGLDLAEANAEVGKALGQVLSRLLQETSIQRAVISGGDTSGHATRQLGVDALTALAPTVPGAALCAAHGTLARPLQLALKGGQMGTPDYFGWIRAGGGAAYRNGQR